MALEYATNVMEVIIKKTKEQEIRSKVVKICLEDKKYIINLMEREIKKAEKQSSNLHDYRDRIKLLEKIIKFLETEIYPLHSKILK